MNEQHEEKDAMTECIENCIECHAVCMQTLSYALDSGSGKFDGEKVRQLYDCAEICHLSASFMLRDSENHQVSCGACAEICEKTANMAKEMKDDEMLQVTAEIAEACAKSCREMAN